jgi:hypothetical protein
MSLNATKPPAEGIAIVREAIGKLVSHPSPTTSMLAESVPAELSITAPHPVYFVGLTDVAEGRLLSAATLTGWRYLVLAGEEPIGAASVTVRADDENLQFSHISHGPFVRNTIEGISRAESLAEVQSNDYELRLLDIPGLYVVSLWLHGNDDRIIPLPPTNRSLEPYRTYTEEQMLESLKQAAYDRLESEEPTPS